MACEHLSNICALTLYSDGIACMFFMHTPMAPVWLFYSKQSAVAIMNSTKISERYSLRKGNNVWRRNVFARVSYDIRVSRILLYILYILYFSCILYILYILHIVYF